MMQRLRRYGAPLAVANVVTLLAGSAPFRGAHADDRAEVTSTKSEAVEEKASLRVDRSVEADAVERNPNVQRLQAQRGVNLGALAGATAGIGESLPSDGAKNEVGSESTSLPQGAGTVLGMGESFSTDPSTGIATFRIPIALPPARGAAQPHLTLSYSSAAGHALAGVGWDLPIAFISRQTDRGVPQYQDPAIGGPWQPTQDRFVFNGGQELVPICLVTGGVCSAALAGEAMPAWAEGWQYFRPRVEGAFLRFFWSPDHRTWRIQSKAGTSMELGVPLDGSGDTNALESDPSNASHVFRWNLTREYDAQGGANPNGSATPTPNNAVVYRYTSSNGISYLSDVYDTVPAANASTASTTSYAHHAHLNYETRTDPTLSFRRGWEVLDTQRLTGVDVASRNFAGDPGTPRELVRRIHLTYDPNTHVSLLTSVQVEGRCAAAVSEDGGELLPPTACPMLPPMTLGYQHVAGFSTDGSAAASDLPGFEGFDERVQHLANSPPHSIDETLTELMDINGDALPDVLVTAPALYGGNDGVYFNGTGGALSFSAAQTMGVTGVPPEGPNDVLLSNANVSFLDIDSSGVVDLLHMPQVLSYSVYAPHFDGSSWSWLGRAITTASEQSPKIDFTHHAPDTRVMDVNGDGLVDVVFTSGTEVQTFLALGRYPGGDSQYGSAAWTSASTANISNDPIETCLPWSATAAHFSDPDVRIGDMNGDGFPDIVRLRPGDVRYWPGRGNGFWGTGDPSTCPGDSFGQDRDIAMSAGPQFGIVSSAEALLLEDVNGDGLDDLVKVNFNEVDVYLNVDGSGWTGRHIIANAPPNGSVSNRVRITDINGSGTRDILWGDGNDYKYMDLSGGVRPWVLTSAANGLGKTTQITYATSTQQMLAAAAAGNPWQSTSPMVSHMVASVTTRDNLGVVGHADGNYQTIYTYRDPVFDGKQREFRGFRDAQVQRVGDDNSPTSTQETTFLLGECKDEPGGPAVSPCTPQGLWEDNPREALKGRPLVSEAFDTSGTYLSTSHTTYRLRHLYSGLDGREVRVAFASQSDSYLYDAASFAPAASTTPATDVELESPLGTVSTDTSSNLTLRSTTGRAHLQQSALVDPFGNATDRTDNGCVDGCGALDESITVHTTPSRRSDDPSGWMWRTTESYVFGSNAPASLRNHTFIDFDLFGHPVQTRAILAGTLPLDRFHENAAKAVAPAPPNASVDGTIVVSSQTYDAFGNVTSQTAPNGRCGSATFDAAYAELATLQTTLVGSIGGSGCGTTPLTTIAAYDRGLGVVTTTTDVRGEVSLVTYDGFGRVTAAYKPDPTVVGSPSSVPSLLVAYFLTTNGVTTPYSRVHVQMQDGPDANTAQYREAWTYIDGLGRKIVTLAEADTSAGDGGNFIASGWTTYDAKGGTKQAYLPFFVNGDASVFALSTVPPTNYERQRYDAFGRSVQTFTLDGAVASESFHHALSEDVWDAADLSPGPHQGTPASMRRDGHGRTVSLIEREHVGGAIEAHDTQTTYLPTGEPLTITRVRVGAADAPVVRWARYDSLGRRVLNVEPNTTSNFTSNPNADPSTFHAWRYAYDDNGDLVGTSDARGCGANYLYDAGGRNVAEDYSPCQNDQADYSAPNLASGMGVEVLNSYDSEDADASSIATFTPNVALYLGRIASISDRGAKTIPAYDGRGRLSSVARRIAKPGPADNALAARYAPTWYVKGAAYDGADRPVMETTGASVPELLAVDGTSAITMNYSARGTVRNVGGSYGSLVANMSYDADALPGQITYGDIAATSTTFSYDVRRRVSTVQTYRGPPPLWSAPPPTYSPAPAPSGAPSSFQADLQDLGFVYDSVDNPIEIDDYRDPSAWPTGAKPVTRKIQYDDLYRVARVDAQYAAGADAWVSPFAAENAGIVPSSAAKPSPQVSFDKRSLSQTFAYDWLGNTTQTGDDAGGFYDRSLGSVTNGTASAGPYQLKGATNAGASARDGHLSAQYDAAGDLTSLAVRRNGPCLPAGALCSQRFVYAWDEVGHLVEARRWDLSDPGLASDSTPAATASANLQYAYDSNDQRVLKSAIDASANELHTVYVFASLELRRAQFESGDYERDKFTEAPQLFAAGTRLGRVYFASNGEPTASGTAQHVFLELPDQLGSTSIVLDKDTSELVEASSYQAYGAPESDYRADRWKGARADYRFTGKEDDIEVGLTYFGKRYLSAALNRWASADPLTIHAFGADLNCYAYVRSRAYSATDPLGLDDYVNNGVASPGEGAPVSGTGNAESGGGYAFSFDDPGPSLGPDGSGTKPSSPEATVSLDSGTTSQTAIPTASATPTPEQHWEAAQAGIQNSAVSAMEGIANQGLHAMEMPLGALALVLPDLSFKSMRASVPSGALHGDYATGQGIFATVGLGASVVAPTLGDTAIETFGGASVEEIGAGALGGSGSTGAGAAQTNRLAIGRGADLAKPGALQPGEFKLEWPSRLPDFKAEWQTNSGLLRQEMGRGLPIRDVSPGDKGGIFLNAERNLLESHGWKFDRGSSLWMPPGGG